MASRMTDDARVADGVDCAAAGPHCGVCRHVTFGADWERTPRCSHWDEATEVEVGNVCEAFEPVRTAVAEGR